MPIATSVFYLLYLHRFELKDNPMCPRGAEKEQITNNLIFQCKKLHNQSEQSCFSL